MIKYFYKYNSPIGVLTLLSKGEALNGLLFEKGRLAFDMSEGTEEKLPVFEKTIEWLNIYFKGEEPDFKPDIALEGSQFRLSVWKALGEIPYGKTITYGDIAEKLAKEKGIKKMSARAVGSAVGANPIGIIIPCHRVVGKNGSLTGFGGGIEAKIYLLKKEGAYKSSFYIPLKN